LYKEKQDRATIECATKCMGGSFAMQNSKTQELIEFLKLNDRILRFKKRTIRNIEELTNINKRQANGMKDGH
jgi:hypothetical protein